MNININESINNMSTNTKSIILSIFLVFGIILLTLDYYFAYNGIDFSNEIFWLSIIISAIVLLQIVYFRSTNLKIIFLLVAGFILSLPNTLRSPEFSIFVDEIIHMQTTKLIYEYGTLNIENTFLAVSKNYPGIELLAVSLSNLTGLPIFYSGKIIVILIHSSILLLIFFMFKQLVDENFAYLGSLIYVTNPRYAFFDAIFGYETLGIILVILMIYLLVRHVKYPNAGNILLITILIFAVTITHHFSSYMLLLFMILYTLYELKNRIFLSKLTIVLAVVILSWIIYIAIDSTVTYYGNIFTEKLKNIIDLTLFEDTGQRKLMAQPIPMYEKIIDILYFPIVGILSLSGIYLYRKDRLSIKEYKGYDSLIKTFMIYGPILFFVSLPFVLTTYDFYRSFAFLFIGISFISCISLLNFYRYRRTLSMILFLILMVGGTSIAIGPTARAPDLSPDFASEMATVTKDVITASNWFEQSFGRYNKIFGDKTVIYGFGGHGIQKFSHTSSKVFYPKTIDADVKYFLSSYSDYIIVDKRITELLPTTQYYFDRFEHSINKSYGIDMPLPKENIDKFNDDIKIYRIYDNGNIITYREYYKI